MKSYVIYYRVSRKSQGIDGLGMEAQQRAVNGFLSLGSREAIAEFREVESGKNSARPQLAKAIARCELTGATLLIAKLDRLARNVHFLTGLMERGVDFVACDMPSANKLTVHILAAVAQDEAERISARTKAALQSIKDRIERDGEYVTKGGRTITRLGNPNGIASSRPDLGVATIIANADAFAKRVSPTIMSLRGAGDTLKQIASKLNAMHVRTSRGKKWTATAVRRVIART